MNQALEEDIESLKLLCEGDMESLKLLCIFNFFFLGYHKVKRCPLLCVSVTMICATKHPETTGPSDHRLKSLES